MTITALTASAGFAGGFGQSEIVIASFQPYLFFPEHDTVTNSSKLNEIIREIKNTWQHNKITRAYLTLNNPIQQNIHKGKRANIISYTLQIQYNNKVIKMFYTICFSLSYFFWCFVSRCQLIIDVCCVTVLDCDQRSMTNNLLMMTLLWTVYIRQQIRSKDAQENLHLTAVKFHVVCKKSVRTPR